MRIAITGATGLIGSAVVRAAAGRGDHVIALSRSRGRAQAQLGDQVEVHEWPDPVSEPPPTAALEHADAVLHLLGEPVAQRWSDDAKQKIRDSRVLSTRSLVSALAAVERERRPTVLVSQSATGFYGPRGPEAIDEQAAPGTDFLAEVTAAWEAEARAAERAGLRVALPRTGVVLARGGGALAKMLPPFRLGVGGAVAGGRQYVPWVHLDDVVGALLRCADDAQASGPVNLTAPRPATNGELSRALGHVLHRPAFLPVPGLALRVLYGDMASIVTTGARVVPARLQELGYEFMHPELEPALRDVLDRT
ncbi:MAG: uncharacterized protein QOD66_848 [Solirubrobacteraceae bacterium]|nr:uncharacterized protein [Solirubrobacteraceae bacterium]